jgi:hypothetical protein
VAPVDRSKSPVYEDDSESENRRAKAIDSEVEEDVNSEDEVDNATDTDDDGHEHNEDDNTDDENGTDDERNDAVEEDEHGDAGMDQAGDPQTSTQVRTLNQTIDSKKTLC